MHAGASGAARVPWRIEAAFGPPPSRPFQSLGEERYAYPGLQGMRHHAAIERMHAGFRRKQALAVSGQARQSKAI